MPECCLGVLRSIGVLIIDEPIGNYSVCIKKKKNSQGTLYKKKKLMLKGGGGMYLLIN